MENVLKRSKPHTKYDTLESLMARHERLITILQWSLILLILAFIALTVWDRYYPYKIVEFHSATVIGAERVVPGAMIWIDIKYSKYMDISAASTKTLICGKRNLLLGIGGGGNPVGDNQEAIVPVTIPNLGPVEWETIKREMGGQAICRVRGDYRYTLPSGREERRYWETGGFPVQ
jgi:hypothetical protein